MKRVLWNVFAVAWLLLLAGCARSSVQQAPKAPDPNMASHSKQTNRLAAEKSPYLLQHQHNPVDWYPWGDEAFAKARREDKPIFLSIGYSTCHWCHVMERESFESDTLAAYLNQHFVPIKVDREERPDVDKIYMTFVQAMTGQGGWPLNIFLAPDLKPFYGGTYWPPDSKYGRPGFLQVLEQVDHAWRTKRERLTNSASELHGQLLQFTTRDMPAEARLGPDLLDHARTQLKEGYDSTHGGWGSAPKFPSPSHPALLLRLGVRHQDRRATEMVLHTLERMAAGGIHDQIGGGFSRYSVDAKWLVPHFEKMLYDNAQLLDLYLDCWVLSGQPRYAEVARDIVEYILRDMTHPDGGFYSAEDADSEGKEGKFYCWTREELAAGLTPEEFKVATRVFGVTAAGNFVDHSDPSPLPNQNVLSLVETEVPANDRPLLEAAKRKLFEIRSKRVRPHLDDKVLASWNGLMLGALARAGIVLSEERYLAAARKNLNFLQSRLWDSRTKTLYHRWRDGERDSVQLLDAYAFLLSGVLDLYQATLEPAYLEFALTLAEAMLARFHDANGGGFWQSGAEASDLILRVKEDYDGAEPSGNSVAVLALLKLAAITERSEFVPAAEKALRLFSSRMQEMPQGVARMLLALDFSLEPPRRVVLAGDLTTPVGRSLLQAAHAVYQPGKVVLASTGPVEPFARTLPPRDGKATAYVCTGTSCQPPTHDPEKLKESLR
jgi:uncharacterized protein